MKKLREDKKEIEKIISDMINDYEEKYGVVVSNIFLHYSLISQGKKKLVAELEVKI